MYRYSSTLPSSVRITLPESTQRPVRALAFTKLFDAHSFLFFIYFPAYAKSWECQFRQVMLLRDTRQLRMPARLWTWYDGIYLINKSRLCILPSNRSETLQALKLFCTTRRLCRRLNKATCHLFSFAAGIV